jgi:invasion protein IalB
VSFRPAENVRNEVAAVLGFATKDGGASDVAIGSTKYDLVTKGANAWVKTPAEEPQVIATMSKGTAMMVTATSARGNKTTDRYSLAGFGQALERAKKECP